VQARVFSRVSARYAACTAAGAKNMKLTFLRSLLATVALIILPSLARALPPGGFQAGASAGATGAALVGRTVRIVGPAGNERSFVVSRVLGKGLNGTTVLARDPWGEVAVKVANPGDRAETTRRGFDHEADMLRTVGGAHEGLPGAFGHGVGHLVKPNGGDGQRVLVLKLARGIPLGIQTVGNGQRAYDGPRDPRPPKLAAQITLSLLDIIEAMRTRGVAHRDIHPANLRMEGDDPSTLTLLDFGAARRLVGPIDGSRDLVDTGRVLTFLTTRRNAARFETIEQMPDVRRQVNGRIVTLADVARQAQRGEFASPQEFRRALAPFAR
jgi:serine/threonine protein kinase